MNRDDIKLLKISGFYQTRGRGLYVFTSSSVLTESDLDLVKQGQNTVVQDDVNKPELTTEVELEDVNNIKKIKHLILIEQIILDLEGKIKTLIKKSETTFSLFESAKELIEVADGHVDEYIRFYATNDYIDDGLTSEIVEDEILSADAIKRVASGFGRKFWLAVMNIRPKFNSGDIKKIQKQLKKAKQLAELHLFYFRLESIKTEIDETNNFNKTIVIKKSINFFISSLALDSYTEIVFFLSVLWQREHLLTNILQYYFSLSLRVSFLILYYVIMKGESLQAQKIFHVLDCTFLFYTI